MKKLQLPPCPSGVYWQVERGDTVFSIARATGVSMAVIIAANPGIDPNNPRVGSHICIPDQKSE